MERATEEHFAHDYKAYVKRIYSYCLLRTDSPQDAEDIAAETFARYFARRDAVAPDFLLPWLYRVARNLCTDHYRSAARRQILEEELDLVSERSSSPWTDGLVWEALKKLDHTQQQIIYLKVVEEMQFKEIAELLKKKESTVKMSFYRGLKKLEGAVKKEDGFAWESAEGSAYV